MRLPEAGKKVKELHKLSVGSGCNSDWGGGYSSMAIERSAQRNSTPGDMR